jgi:hypothetical protein
VNTERSKEFGIDGASLTTTVLVSSFCYVYLSPHNMERNIKYAVVQNNSHPLLISLSRNFYN